MADASRLAMRPTYRPNVPLTRAVRRYDARPRWTRLEAWGASSSTGSRSAPTATRWCAGVAGSTSGLGAARRPDPQRLFHSALVVRPDAGSSVIEMAPVWSSREPDRGIVVEGPVGRRWLGRSRLFRYEVRPGVTASSPTSATRRRARRRRRSGEDGTACLAPRAGLPTRTWGLDERGTGEMWNSNSLVSWLLSRAGLPVAISRHRRRPRSRLDGGPGHCSRTPRTRLRRRKS